MAQCEYCENGEYYECGPEGEARCDDSDVRKWCPAGEVTIKPNTDYWMKCKPGSDCLAKVEPNPDSPGAGWRVYKADYCKENILPGKYKIEKQQGSGGCHVRIRKVKTSASG